VAGLIAAEQLERMGISYLIFDPHAAPGGNWRDNPYPGAGVDTPSHLYSFSFAPYDWGQHFSLRADLQQYFSYVAESLGISSRIRFGTTVQSAQFDVDAGLWRLSIQSGGTTEEIRVPVLITAAGVLNRPKTPNLPGRDTYRGIDFHSSRWPAGLDLREQTVAVVGTGASAMQIVPAIAAQVKKVLVFQRTPPWVAPFEKFHRPIDADHRQLMMTYRHYRAWYWVKLYWQFGDKILDALRIDPGWAHPERAVNAQNDAYRRYFTRYIRDELGRRDDLVAKVVPDYPPFGKRILLDNGWYRTLKRENVTLVDEAVARLTEGGLVTESGLAFEADVVVWATGFEATQFLASMEVEGRDGLTLHDAWSGDDPRAYLGVTVPGFPNLFMLGGPNSFPGSGSYMHSIEVQMRYIARILTEMRQAGARFVEPRPEVFERFNRQLDAVSLQTVWSHPRVKTYYCNEHGRLVFLSPFRNIDYWDLTARSGLADYVVTPEAVDTT
jgi:4-hydroxyacetophenone monooxygenase